LPRCVLAALLLAFLSSNAEACFPQCLKRLFGGEDERTTVAIVGSNQKRPGSAPLHRNGPQPAPELQLAVRDPPPLSAAAREIRPIFAAAYPQAGQDDQLFARWLRTIEPATGTRLDMLSYGFERSDFGIQADLHASTQAMNVLITAPAHNDEAYSLAAREWGYGGTESVGGLWARLRFAMGVAGVSSIHVQFGEENMADFLDYRMWEDTRGFLEAADLTMSGIYIRNLYGLNATSLVSLSEDPQSYSFLFTRHDDVAVRLTLELPQQPQLRRIRGVSKLPLNIDDMDNAYEDPVGRNRGSSENGNDEEKEEILRGDSTEL
jgi:hypothetical protein